eukprot:UC4_evm9s1341
MATKTAEMNSWDDLWDSMAGRHEESRKINGWGDTSMEGEEFSRGIKQLLGMKPGAKVLEVGCGAGYLGQYFVGDYDYEGCDRSPTMVAKCAENLKCRASVAEGNDLSAYKDKSFDYVIVISVFQYFPTLEYAEKAISEIERVAVRGACICDVRANAPRELKRSDQKVNYAFTEKKPLEHLQIQRDVFAQRNWKISQPFMTDYGDRIHHVDE